MTRLAKEIRSQIQLLVGDNYTKLVPRDDDPETVYLKLAMDGEVAIVERHEFARGAVRAYRIDPDGGINRSITSPPFSPQDRRWCHEPLTRRRLAYLHRVAHGKADYSPRRANSSSY
jgi:hypothetical protein